MDNNAPGLALPNDQNPKPHSKAYYGNQHVPHPNNKQAEKVNPSEVMRAVNEGK